MKIVKEVCKFMKTQFTIAYRCAKCGKIGFREISIFELSGRRSLKVQCENCGHNSLILYTKDYKNYRIQMDCVICKTPHIYYFSLGEIFREEPIIIECIQYDLELCFIGERQRVEQKVDQYEQGLEELIDELGYDDYFVNSEIMMECVNILHDLAEQDQISCECGKGDIGIILLSDRIELRCQYCHNVHIIPAESRRDVERLKDQKEVYMKKSNSQEEAFHRDLN